jgi:putative PLP-dependent aminotransferase (TIGR04422 family)
MISNEKHFIWPKMQVSFASFFGSCLVKKLEDKLHLMFPSGHPVLCSSGRVAIFIALKESGLNRYNYVKLFPYASHCVVNSVARIATPVPFDFEIFHKEIIYHQWGYPANSKNTPLIEDCVDCLYEKQTKLFSLGSSFEVWSFPKILGTSSGGVLWCKNKKVAISIREKMNHKKNIRLSWILRLLSNYFPEVYPYWEGTEIGYKGLSRFQRNEIFCKLNTWDELVLDRKQKLKMFSSSHLFNKIDFKGRLPNVIPLETKMNEEELIKLGFSSGFRHFLIGKRLVKVLPIPIHQDISLDFIADRLKLIIK